MTKKIPFFPLGLVAFPGEILNLHIFETRYKQLVKDCLDNNLSFGIIPVNEKRLAVIGTEMQITEVVHVYPDGKMDIRCKGLNTFRLIAFQEKIEDKLYPGGEVEVLEEEKDTQLKLQVELFKLVSTLYTSMNMPIDMPTPHDDFLIYDIAHKLGLNTDQEIELLQIRSEKARLTYVLDHLHKLIPVVTQMEELRHKVQMNGHFKDVLPPDFEI